MIVAEKAVRQLLTVTAFYLSHPLRIAVPVIL